VLRTHKLLISVFILCVSTLLVGAVNALAQDSANPASTSAIATSTTAQLGGIEGTATDPNDNVLPGATVVLQGPDPADRQVKQTNAQGFFSFSGVKPGIPYTVVVSLNGFADWKSEPIVLNPGQFAIVPNINVRVQQAQTTVNVSNNPEEIATEQVRIETQQRVFGIIPNFYVVYDTPEHPAQPLTARAKFKLAMRLVVDPVTIAGIGFMSGLQQAGDTPDYQQGMKGYGQRFGANLADTAVNNLIGGAILPSVLHQDPRYFYRGTGTKRSRFLYAAAHPFICKSDSGKTQVNVSTMGGDLAQSAISNLYYPSSNRGAGLVFGNFALSTAQRVMTGLLQEFVLPKFTHRAKDSGDLP
jgi:hypothetical protein